MRVNSKHIIPTILALLLSLGMAAQVSDPFGSSVAFTHTTINDGMSSNMVLALVQDENGFVWAGTDRGVNRFDGHRITPIKSTLDLSVTCMDMVKDTLWIGTSEGLYIYTLNGDSVRNVNLATSSSKYGSLDITDMQYDGKGTLWFTTMSAGIFRFKTATEELFHVATPDSARMYGHIYISKEGRVWAASNWNKHNIVLYQHHSDTFVPYDLKFDGDSPSKIMTIALTQAGNGSMWAALWDGSVISFDSSSRKATLAFTAQQTGMRHAHSITEVEPGRFFVGSDHGLAALTLSSGSVKVYSREGSMASNLSDDFIYPILKDREGGTWIGTFYGGINYTHPISSNFVTCAHSKYVNSVSGNVINKFCEDNQGRLWISSDDGGLCYYDSATKLFTNVPLAPGGGNHNTHALCLDGDDLYVGTYAQGMDIVNTRTMHVENIPAFRDASGKSIDRSSYAIYKDRSGRIWVGTFRGAALFDSHTRTFTQVKNVGVPVLDILEDCVDCIWLATEGNGLWRLDARGQWKQYSSLNCEHTLPGVSAIVRTLYEDRDGNLWVGASSGLFKYDRSADKFEHVGLGEGHIGVYGIADVDSKLWLTTSNGIICYSLTLKSVLKVYKSGGNVASINFMPDAVYGDHNGRVYAGTTSGFISFRPRSMRSNAVKPTVVFTDLEVFNRHVPVGSELLPVPLPDLKELKLSYRESVFRISFSAMSYLSPKDITYRYYLEGFDKEWIESIGNSVTYTNLSPGTYILHVKAIMNDGMQSEDAILRVTITPPFYWNGLSQTIYAILILLVLYLTVRHLLRLKELRHVAQIQEITVQKEQAIQEITEQKEHEINEVTEQKEQAILEITEQKEQEIKEVAEQKEQEIKEITEQKEQEIKEIIEQKEQELKEVAEQKEQEIKEVTEQKEQEIKAINARMEEELHNARIHFMILTDKDQNFLDNLEKAVERNYANPDFAIDDLAEEMGVSRSSLFNKIKALADVTPNELIQIVRLRHAASLLDSGNYLVSEVCYMVGFSSPSYFAKCFQRLYGVTPVKYKA